MKKLDQTTRDKILQAALSEFHGNGFRGARTNRIAEAAGISRTMLHYYFNTKEALFEAVVGKTFGAVMPHLQKMADQETGITELVENLVAAIADLLEENPGLPSFVVNILNESPELLLNLVFLRDERSPDLIESVLKKARRAKQVRPEVNGEDLLINIYALCSTPYLLAPYISKKEGRDLEMMREFIRGRRSEIVKLVLSGIHF